MNPFREPRVYATVPRVQQLVANFYNNTLALKEVYRLLSQYGLKGYLFGGAIRDMVSEYPCLARPRDLDIVVVGDHSAYQRMIDQLPASLLGTKAAARGQREAVEGSGRENTTDVKIGGEAVELWHISRQRGMSEFQELDIANVPASTFLVIESIVASVGPDEVEVHDAGFCKTMNDRVMDCRTKWQDRIIPEKAAVKALALSSRLDMTLTAELGAFVRKTIGGMTVDAVCDQLRARYGKVLEIPELLPIIGGDAVKKVDLGSLSGD